MIRNFFIKINASSLLLFVSLFLLSLTSHTIYSWAIGLLALILYVFIEKIDLSRIAVKEAIILGVLLIISILRFQLFIIKDALPLYINAFWGNLSLYVICIIVWLILRSILKSTKKESFLNIITLLLAVHVLAFYLQFVVFLISGYYIDLLEPITGESSRYQSFTSSLSLIGSVRPTGFYVEPSTYFYAILALSSMLVVTNRASKQNKLMFFTVLSMFLSFSTAAVIIGFLFSIYFLINARLKLYKYIIIGITFILIAIVFNEPLEKLFMAQNIKYENTSGSRFGLVDAIMDRDPSKVLFASGAFSKDNIRHSNNNKCN